MTVDWRQCLHILENPITLTYSCRSRVTVGCALPFTTNVTISTSISQTFRSWVAIFHLRQPIVFLSHSSYGMPGLAPLMNVLLYGRRDCHLISSDRDMSWNVWNRPSGSFRVDMVISSNIMKSPSPKCYMIFWDMVIYNDILNWSDITPIGKLITELDFITYFELITKFWSAASLLLRTPGPVQFGTCICSYVDTNVSWTCHVYGPFEFRTSLGTCLFLSRSLFLYFNYLVSVTARGPESPRGHMYPSSTVDFGWFVAFESINIFLCLN